MIRYAEQHNAADATADFWRALNDPNRWIVKEGIPLFKAHKRTDPNTGKNIEVDLQKLHEIAANMQRLEQDGGVPVRITLGHTQPSAPETRQPPVAGYYRNARVGVFGPKREPAIIADEWLDPQYGQVRKNFPYRSSEYYDDDKQITGVALLSRDPYLDLGVVAYSRACPGPVHYSRAGAPAPYQFVFGEQEMAQPNGYSPQYGATPPASVRPVYPQHAAPAGQSYYDAPQQPQQPAPVMYASPQPQAYAGDGDQTQYAGGPTPYRGPWPGPAYKKHNIGHSHPSGGAVYGNNRRPAPYRNGPQRPRPQRPARYDDMGGDMGMYDDPMGGPPGMGGGMGQGPPPGMPGMPPQGMGGPPGQPPMGPDPSGAPGGLPEVVGLLEQVLQVLEGQAGMEGNDTPPDSPFPEGGGEGGLQDGPEYDDEGEGGVETEGDDKEDYAYRGRQTAYAPPTASGPWRTPNMDAAGMHDGTYTGTHRRLEGMVGGVQNNGQPPLMRPRRPALAPGGQVVGAPRPSGTQVQNSYYSNTPPRAGRPAASPQQRPGVRRYSREEPMPTPRQPAPRGGQATGRQAAPTNYNQPAPPPAARLRGDRLTYEVEQLKEQNRILMYERDQADTNECVAEISRLASLGYPVDEWEVSQLKQTPKEHRRAYLDTIATRYSRVPTDGIAPMPGDPSPAHLEAPQGPVRLTREGMDYALKLSQTQGIPLEQAMQYAKGEAAPTMYGPQAPAGYAPPAPGYAAPGLVPYGPQPQPYPQQFEYPQFGSGAFGDPYPNA